MKAWHGVLIFVIGNLTGGTVTYLYLKDKRDADMNAELAEIREKYYNKMERIESENKAKEIIKEEGYIKYNTSEKEQAVLVDKIKEVTKKSNDHPRDDYPNEPIIITEEDFSETELYFEKEEVEYYLDDGALVNASDELLIVDDTIGFDNLDAFLKDEDCEMTYIRNAELGTDYEVRKVSGKYSDMIGIGGADEED